MKRFKLGVLLESFRLPAKKAIEEASKLGLDGVQIFATTGEFSPDKMTANKKKELLSMLNCGGLEISALCGDFGMGFGDESRNYDLIEKSKKVITLAKELGTNIVTTHIGVVPNDPTHDRYKIMQEACAKLAEFADSLDAHFAVETGPETSATLKSFLDSLNSKGVAVNLDPANLVMVTGDNPVTAVDNLKDYIVHTHAKDGIKHIDCNPEYIYRVLHPMPEEFKNQRLFSEVPLGTGSVPYADYLDALERIGYNGYLTIEREVGDNPVADIKTAVDYLRNFDKVGK